MLTTRTPRSVHTIIAASLLFGALAGCAGEADPATDSSGTGQESATGSGPASDEAGDSADNGSEAEGRWVSVSIGAETFTAEAGGCHIGATEFYVISEVALLPDLYIAGALAMDEADEMVVTTDLGTDSERSWTASLATTDVTIEAGKVVGGASFSGEHDGVTADGSFEIQC